MYRNLKFTNAQEKFKPCSWNTKCNQIKEAVTKKLESPTPPPPQCNPCMAYAPGAMSSLAMYMHMTDLIRELSPWQPLGTCLLIQKLDKVSSCPPSFILVEYRYKCTCKITTATLITTYMESCLESCILIEYWSASMQPLFVNFDRLIVLTSRSNA
jgi:hypothetical protein